ncbi:MAG TPA: adenylate/guanylate cyclase domain-containing protein [Ignavibacteria bacterium]|jgi:adenylate cyclase
MKKGFLKEAGFNILFWVIACSLFVIYRYFGVYDYTEYFIKIKSVNLGLMFAEANIVAVFYAFLISLVDYAFDIEKFKRASFRNIILIKSIAYSLIIFFAIVSIFVTHGILTNQTEGRIMYSLNYTFSSQYPIALFIYGVSMSLLLNFIKQVNKKFGPGILWKLFSGKYHRPRQEERIFMFLDLRSSTTIAEKLAHIRYSEFIQDCFYDITSIIARYKAEIYQYVGDEIILTWEMNKGMENENCFHFYFAFKQLLCKRKDFYLKKFGIIPEFKAGMNCGFVTVAEVGEIKKEIAYHGDVLNTAARIQDQCNKYNKDILMSNKMHRLMPRFEGFRGELIGEVLLKGKNIPTGLYSLEFA